MPIQVPCLVRQLQAAQAGGQRRLIWREVNPTPPSTITSVCLSLHTTAQWQKLPREEVQLFWFACIVVTISVAGILTATLHSAQCGGGSRRKRKRGVSRLPTTKHVSFLGQICESLAGERAVLH